MAFSDSTNPQNLTCLTREIATLTATLQRERQRRSAIAAHAKDVEHRADAAEMKLKQVQYANKKLEEELSQYKENEVQNRAYDEENAELKAQLMQLKSELTESRALQQELLQLHIASANSPATAPLTAEAPSPASLPAPSTTHHDVDAAVKELTAIVPQYRASILALQGRIAVLNKQLEQVTMERDQLQRDVATWRDTAERTKASFADVAVKLHSQEAASLESMTSSQQLASRLEAELSALRQQYTVAEKELEDARKAAQQAQQAVDSQQKLLSTQSNTISRLETTVREQQEDIIAALDLVCHRAPSGLSGAPNGGCSAEGDEFNLNMNTKEINIDSTLDFLDTLGINGVSQHTSTGGAAPGAAAFENLDEENWTIPAGGNGSSNAVDGNNYDDLATWLHDPSVKSISKHTSPLKNSSKLNLQQNLGAAARKSQGADDQMNSSEMSHLAADIAALRDALQRVL